MLLTLLTYCYAIGVYASREIESLTYADENVRYLAVNSHPSSEDLRHFRRSHRDTLEACLAGVLNQVWRQSYSVLPPEAADRRQAPELQNRNSSSYPLMLKEAQSRLDRAVLYDYADRDD